MISEGRLSGFVDQIESVLHFQGNLFAPVEFNQMNAFFSSLASEQLAQWDRRIESFCVQVNQVLDKIQVVHPDWCQKTMASVEAKINAARQSMMMNTYQQRKIQATTNVKSMDVS